jgi:hypothetical protein
MNVAITVLSRLLGIVTAMVGLSIVSFHDVETDRAMLAGIGLVVIGAWLSLRRADPPA